MTSPGATSVPAPSAAGDGHPWLVLGLAVGPVAFVAGWVVGGAAMPDGYSPVQDAISRIAAVGSPERATMTAALLAYGAAVAVGAVGLRDTALRRCWPLALANGLATVAVAATPLDHSSTVDLLHGLSATVGYLTITAVPLVAVGPLRRQGCPRAAALSVLAGAVSGGCLVLTASAEAKGLFQRVGLLSGDVWLVAAAGALLGRRLRPTA